MEILINGDTITRFLNVVNHNLALTFDIGGFTDVVTNNYIDGINTAFSKTVITAGMSGNQMINAINIEANNVIIPRVATANAANPYITDNGYFLPPFTKTSFQNAYDNFKLGWFISFGMETIWSEDFSDGMKAPNTFNLTNINVAAWAALAASYNKIDYAVLTINHAYGFSLHGCQTAIWRGITTNNGVQNIPVYDKYDAGVSGDPDIVSKFITEFNAVGIKPILYVNVGVGVNYTTVNKFIDTYTDATYQFTAVFNFWKERIQELCRLEPFGMWLDSTAFFPQTYLRQFYYVIKSINPNIGVIVNSTGVDLVPTVCFPSDAGIVENFIRPAHGDNFWLKSQVHNGITYPCSKELTDTSFSASPGKWFYHQATEGLETLSTLQARYNAAKAEGVPYCVTVCPKADGTIYQAQADLVGSITL